MKKQLIIDKLVSLVDFRFKHKDLFIIYLRQTEKDSLKHKLRTKKCILNAKNKKQIEKCGKKPKRTKSIK